MLTFDEAKTIIATRGWLSQTPEDFRRAVLSRVSLQSYEAGESIYSVGDPPGGMYGLAAGSVKIASASGRARPLSRSYHDPRPLERLWTGDRRLQPDRRPHARGAIARFCFSPFMRSTRSPRAIPGSWRYIAGLSLSDTQIALGAMDDLTIRDEFHRCIAILLRSGGLRHVNWNNGEPVRVDVNQSELAHMSNLSRSALGGFLRKLEAEGEIEIGYGQIGILKPAALRARLARVE